MLAEYVSCGGTAERFWGITPREMSADFDGFRRRADREHEARAWLAWHAALLPHSKKIPRSFDEFVGRKKPAAQKTAAEIEGLVRAWLGSG